MRIFIIALLLTQALKLPCLAASQSGDVSVVNAGFEQSDAAGVPAGWVKTGGGGELKLDTAEKADGKCSLRLRCNKGQDVQAASEKLSLAPLRLYQLELWVKRTQGNEIGFWIETTTSEGVRQESLQLHWPGRYQPNWFPPAPCWTMYRAYFATGRNETGWRLVIKQRCPDDRIGKACWVDGLSLKETGAVQTLASGKLLRNLLPIEAAEFVGDDTGKPTAWSLWWGDSSKVKVVPGGAQYHGNSVKFESGNFGLAGGCFPVQEGRLYHLRLSARGKGSVSLGIHQLGDAPGYWCRSDTAMRLGNTHGRDFSLSGSDWKQLEGDWIAEIPGIRWFNPYLAISGTVELSDVSLTE